MGPECLFQVGFCLQLLGSFPKRADCARAQGGRGVLIGPPNRFLGPALQRNTPKSSRNHSRVFLLPLSFWKHLESFKNHTSLDGWFCPHFHCAPLTLPHSHRCKDQHMPHAWTQDSDLSKHVTDEWAPRQRKRVWRGRLWGYRAQVLSSRTQWEEGKAFQERVAWAKL